MLTYAALGRALVASALTFTIAPSFAASGTTDIYLANVKLNVEYLEGSSRLAAKNAQSAEIKNFATGTMRHQGDVIAALDGWRAKTEGATPIDVASVEMQTGRSTFDATIDPGKFAAPAGIGVLMPAATVTLGQLSAMTGETFDATYKATQSTALKRLAGFYEAYSHNGDDATLRDMARGELAEVRAEIAALDKA